MKNRTVSWALTASLTAAFSDGARAMVGFSGPAAVGVSVVAGTAVVATAFSAGWVLSAAGVAIAYIPNAVGKALLYNGRVTR